MELISYDFHRFQFHLVSLSLSYLILLCDLIWFDLIHCVSFDSVWSFDLIWFDSFNRNTFRLIMIGTILSGSFYNDLWNLYCCFKLMAHDWFYDWLKWIYIIIIMMMNRKQTEISKTKHGTIQTNNHIFPYENWINKNRHNPICLVDSE